jgi:hypothetical protein
MSKPAAASTTAVTENGYRLPADSTLQHAAKLAIVEDRPIMLDYWNASLDKTCFFGVREPIDPKEPKEKFLVKTEEEYTSPIVKLFKSVVEGVGFEYIIITENSIYVVNGDIPTRKISNN